jgi:Hint domain
VLTVTESGSTVFTMETYSCSRDRNPDPDGEFPVEKLRPGNQVITLVDGQEIRQTVTWLGHRRIGLAGHPRRRPVKPVFSDSDRLIFVLPRGAREVRLVSRAQSPTEARPWLEDRRRLGVRVKRIVLHGADELREVPVDHPDLTRGWWAAERDGQVMSRWTDGEAVLPLPAMSGNVILEIHLAGSMIFVVEDRTERRAAA